MKLHAIGIDLGKTVFHLVGLDSTGRVVIRKRCSRTQLLAVTSLRANGCGWAGRARQRPAQKHTNCEKTRNRHIRKMTADSANLYNCGRVEAGRCREFQIVDKGGHLLHSFFSYRFRARCYRAS